MIILGPPGSDKARAAAQCAADHDATHTDTTIIVSGNVLKHYLASIAPHLGRDAVVTFHEFLSSLWKKLYGRIPPEQEKWRFDLDSCVDHVLRERPHRSWTRRPIVLEGERYPAAFYSLLRMLDIPATVFADENYPIREDGSTAPEIRSALGATEPAVLRRNTRTTRPIAAFSNHFYSGSRSGKCVLSERTGPQPALLSTPTFADLVDWLVDFERVRPRQSIGILVRAADLVRQLEVALSGRTLNRTRCYESSRSSLANSLEFGKPGTTILTWQSGTAVEFDAVVLAELQEMHDPRFALSSRMNLHVLSARARTELVLAYSGSGEPSFVDALPMDLVDDLRGSSTVLAPPEKPSPDGYRGETNDSVGFTTIAPVNPAGRERWARQVHAGLRLVDGEHHRRRARRRVLTADEEVGLAVVMRADGTSLSDELPPGYRATLQNSDQRAVAFDLLLLHNIRLVRSIARTYTVSGLDVEDLTQGGVFGLVRAIEKFNASLGHKFSTYASQWIRQSIGRTIDNDSRLIRLPVHMCERIRGVQSAYATVSVAGTVIDLAEVGRRTELTSAQVVEALRLARGIVSLDRPVGENEDATLGEVLDGVADVGSDPAVVVDRQAGAELVARALDRMNPREARILRLRNGFEDDTPWTLEMVGGELGVTRERVRQIEVKAKQNFRNLLTSPETQVRARSRRPAAATPSGTGPNRSRPAASGYRTAGAVLPPQGQAAEARPWRTVAQGIELPAALRRDHRPATLEDLVYEGVEYAVSAGGTYISIGFDLTTPAPWIALRVDSAMSPESDIRTAVLMADALSPRNLPGAMRLTSLILSIADQMAVTTRDASGRSTCLSLTFARMTGHWWLRLTDEDVLRAAERPSRPAATQATIEIRGLRQTWLGIDAPLPVVAAIGTWRARIGLVYGAMIATGNLTIEIADEKVAARDPFATGNPATQDLGTECVRHDGQSVEVTPYVIPHPDRLSGKENDDLGGLAEMRRSQGFYVRCAGHLIVTGSWLGLSGLGDAEETALARVLIEIDPTEHSSWWKEATGIARPPDALRARLIDLAMVARQRSTEVFRHRRDSRAVTGRGSDD
ncbi:sigma-70 family RNA polymerase sigma factor [Frankia sp. Cr2]|uniref:sigma-70 family RNA polymerase sigma factor n=1 Tax=Frankia sp. Cr2 TaxID=3073932 RepID=UPI002AD54337|nr:sigma-70 family RNA polymerase sigma factor [Frankia sp. Cr2]